MAAHLLKSASGAINFLTNSVHILKKGDYSCSAHGDVGIKEIIVCAPILARERGKEDKNKEIIIGGKMRRALASGNNLPFSPVNNLRHNFLKCSFE